MKKKFFSKSMAWVLSVVMIFGLFIIPSASVSATSEEDRITQQIIDASSWAHSKYGGSFNGWCGAYVRYTMAALGIIDLNGDRDCSGNGNKFVGNINEGTTSKGYTKTKYSGNNCLTQIINANGGGNVYNIVISWTHQSSYQSNYSDSNPGAGHVTFIHAIINGNVYFSESYDLSNKPEGSPLVYSLSSFMSKWNGYYGNALGAVQFGGNPTTISYNPEGHLDGADSPEAGKLHVAGWAFDRDDVNASLGIHIYVGGTFAGEISAWKGRADVNGSFPGVGDYHGFEETIDVSQSGTQTVDVYAINVGGGSNVHIGSATVNIAEKISDIYVPVMPEAYVDNVTPYGFRLNAKVSDNVGVSRVEFETWKDGSPLRKTYVAQSIGNDMYIYDVNIADLTDEAGVYHSIVHAYDPSNNHSTAEIYIIVPDKDTVAPTITDVTVSQVTSKGYRVTCRVSDNVGVTSVRFPTWGGGDFKWIDGIIEGDVATCYINTSEFNNEIGDYANHIYAYDAVGNSRSISAGNIYVSDEPIEIASMIYKEHKYVVYNSGKTWTEAEQWCEQNGGYLATVTSETEWNQISELLKKYYGVRCWLGAEGTSGAWRWTTGEPFDYAKWEEGQPDCNGNLEFYLGTYGGGVYDNYCWNDFTNEGVLISGFVFEKVEHQYKTEVIPATCTEKGYTVHTCIICGDSYKDTYTPAKGHKYTETVVKPTATTQGYTLHTCSECGHSYKDNYTDILFTNTTTLDTASIELGGSVNINASAVGGTAPYKFTVKFKKDGSQYWSLIQEDSENSTVSFKPESKGIYTISITASDNRGKSETKSFEITVNEKSAPLSVEADVAEKMTLGDTMTITAKGSGGTGGYTYGVYYKKTTSETWSTVQPITGTSTSIALKPTSAVKYDVCVKVRDTSGTIAKQYFTVTVVKKEVPLTNNSTISKTSIPLGESVTITAKATGGTGSYTYGVYYKKASVEKWTTAQSYNTNATVSIKPGSAVKYDVCVKVKDSKGTIAKQYFTVTVTKELVNSSTVSATTVKKGQSVTVTAKASGGTGKYTYGVYYKKASSENWSTAQSYGTNTTVTITPGAAVKYDICVKVKDSSGKIVKKYFTLTVTK